MPPLTRWARASRDCNAATTFGWDVWSAATCCPAPARSSDLLTMCLKQILLGIVWDLDAVAKALRLLRDARFGEDLLASGSKVALGQTRHSSRAAVRCLVARDLRALAYLDGCVLQCLGAFHRRKGDFRFPLPLRAP